MPWPYTAVDAAYFRSVIASANAHSHWAVHDTAGFAGIISVKPDVGFWLRVERQGLGYMTEAAQAVVASYFLQCDTDLVSGHLLGNAASRRLLLRLGFRDTHVDTVTQAATGQLAQRQRMVLSRDAWHGLRNTAQ